MKKYIQKSGINQQGFTIIEMLVVIIVMMSVGSLIGGIFFISLRSSNKANQLALVRQNGNSAITQIARRIRYTQNFLGLADVEAGPYNYSCTGTSHQYLRVSDPDASGAQVSTTLYCPTNTAMGANDPIWFKVGTNPQNELTDPLESKVKNCEIKCFAQPNRNISFQVKFDMVDKNDSGGLFENSVSAIPFETSVTLRNFPQ